MKLIVNRFFQSNFFKFFGFRRLSLLNWKNLIDQKTDFNKTFVTNDLKVKFDANEIGELRNFMIRLNLIMQVCHN